MSVRRIQIRRGTAAEWTAANPVLLSAEQGLETDTRKRKMGDGVTPWNSLAYDAMGGGGGDGLSAYQVWLAAGNTGDVAAYLASLKGADGDDGDDGMSAYAVWLAAGNTGDVAAYLASIKGAKGDTGLSAYQAWLAAGNTGDAAAFLASLKGTKGDNGASAYQVWLAAGNTGDVTAYLASIKGAKGDPGESVTVTLVPAASWPPAADANPLHLYVKTA